MDEPRSFRPIDPRYNGHNHHHSVTQPYNELAHLSWSVGDPWEWLLLIATTTTGQFIQPPFISVRDVFVSINTHRDFDCFHQRVCGRPVVELLSLSAPVLSQSGIQTGKSVERNGAPSR